MDLNNCYGVFRAQNKVKEEKRKRGKRKVIPRPERDANLSFQFKLNRMGVLTEKQKPKPNVINNLDGIPRDQLSEEPNIQIGGESIYGEKNECSDSIHPIPSPLYVNNLKRNSFEMREVIQRSFAQDIQSSNQILGTTLSNSHIEIFEEETPEPSLKKMKIDFLLDDKQL